MSNATIELDKENKSIMDIKETIGTYIDLRSQVSTKKKEFEDFKREAEVELKILELQILEVSRKTGVDSFKTEFGTAYRTQKTYAKVFSVEDRVSYAKESGDFGLFTSHVNKRHVLELLENGVDPSTCGVDLDYEDVIQFRKS